MVSALPHPSQAEAIEEVVGLLLRPRETHVVEDRHVIDPGLLLSGANGEQMSPPVFGGGLRKTKSGVEVVSHD